MFRVILLVSLMMVVFMAYGCSEEPLTTEDESILSAPKSASLPHDGGCVSYCARSELQVWNGAEWEPFDFNGDGKIQSCHKEINGFLVGGEPYYEGQCHKAVDPITGVPACPEYDGRCILTTDYVLYGGPVSGPEQGDVACVLQHGKDTHK